MLTLASRKLRMWYGSWVVSEVDNDAGREGGRSEEYIERVDGVAEI